MTDIEMKNVVESRNAIVDKIKELEKIQKQYEEQLKKELDTRQADKVELGCYNVFYKAVSRKIADSDKLKADGLFDKYSKESISLRLNITCISE